MATGTSLSSETPQRDERSFREAGSIASRAICVQGARMARVPATCAGKARGSNMTDDRIVAVALLTQRDLNVLGQGFRQSYRVHGAEGFEDLLAQLDDIKPIELAPERSDEP